MYKSALQSRPTETYAFGRMKNQKVFVHDGYLLLILVITFGSSFVLQLMKNQQFFVHDGYLLLIFLVITFGLSLCCNR